MVLVLLITCFYQAGDIAGAVNYDSKIEEAEKEQKSFEKKAEQLEKEIEDIEASREDTLAYIEKLDKKTASLEADIETTSVNIGEKEVELATANEQLVLAEDEMQKQYETMKTRIKYMYENGNQDYLDILFSSRDIGDLLNRAEYIEKISEYDQNMFQEFRMKKEAVDAKRLEIENQLLELEGMKEDLTAEKAALTELTENKKKKIAEWNEKIALSEEQATAYAKKAAEAEAEVEKLLLAKQAEIDAKNGSGSGGGAGGDGTFIWPLKISGRISSYFGPRNSPTAGASSYHKGIDVAAPTGTHIIASASGTVVTATYSSSAGNYVMISHGNRMYTVYMHCSRLAVSEGDSVTQGQLIAYVGSTGISTGAHLHFGISKDGEYVNPLNYVQN